MTRHGKLGRGPQGYSAKVSSFSIRNAMPGAATCGRDFAAKQDFVRACLAEYDPSGWTGPDLVNPDDVTLITRGMTQ